MSKKYKTPAENMLANRKLKLGEATKFMIMVVNKPGAKRTNQWGKEQLDGWYLVYNPDDDKIAFVWKNQLVRPWEERERLTVLAWDSFKEKNNPLTFEWMVPQEPKEDDDGNMYPPFSEVYADEIGDAPADTGSVAPKDSVLCRDLLKRVIAFIDTLTEDEKLASLLATHYTPDVAATFELVDKVLKKDV